MKRAPGDTTRTRQVFAPAPAVTSTRSAGATRRRLAISSTLPPSPHPWKRCRALRIALRPRYAPLIKGLLLATLFVPAVVLLVPLYITIVDPPLVDHSFIDSYWAVWLPAGASAFNVILVTRFFDKTKNVLVYLITSTKVVEGSPFNSISVVPLNQ